MYILSQRKFGWRKNINTVSKFLSNYTLMIFKVRIRHKLSRGLVKHKLCNNVPTFWIDNY